jgi:hypothetical protein
MSSQQDQRRYAPAVERNRAPILEVLARVLPAQGLVLEVASGTGEHAVAFARAFPLLSFQPSDPDSEARESTAAWLAHARCANLRPPVFLDASSWDWPLRAASAVININMIHISPWETCIGLMRGASRVLHESGGPLFLYGPFTQNGQHTAPTNAEFDARLRSQNPAWGVRDLGAVSTVAAEFGLVLREVVHMPANNLSLLFYPAQAAR